MLIIAMRISNHSIPAVQTPTCSPSTEQGVFHARNIAARNLEICYVQEGDESASKR